MVRLHLCLGLPHPGTAGGSLGGSAAPLDDKCSSPRLTRAQLDHGVIWALAKSLQGFPWGIRVDPKVLLVH